MANTKSAAKRDRQSLTRRARNRAGTARMRTAVKKLRAAVAAKDAEGARRLLPQTLAEIDRSASKEIVHRNTAARNKSRLSRLVSSLGS
jgi:small subunit ribosomal protein S20